MHPALFGPHFKERLLMTVEHVVLPLFDCNVEGRLLFRRTQCGFLIVYRQYNVSALRTA